MTTPPPTLTPVPAGDLDQHDPRPMPGRPLWMLGGTLLLLGAIFWGTISVVDVLAHEEWTVFYEQPTQGVQTLSINVDSGRVEVRRGSGDTIAVEASVSRGLFGVTERAELLDDRYQLTARCPAMGSTWCSVDYVVTLPSGIAIDLDVDNGTVILAGIDGGVDVSADNAGVELIGVSGSVVVSGNNGRVVGTGLTSDRVDVRSDNGSVTLAFDEPPTLVDVRANNGSVSLTVPDVGYAVSVSTDNGGQTVDIVSDPRSARTITVSANNGSARLLPAP